MSTRTETLLTSILSHFPAGVESRARRPLSLFLDSRAQANRKEEWQGSALTGSGYPVELAFSTGDSRLRYTVEPGLCSTRPVDRVKLAMAQLVELGDEYRCEQDSALSGSIRAAAPVVYGAWVGGKHSASTDEYKIYFESSELADAGHIGDILFNGKLQSEFFANRAKLRMFAYSPKSRIAEAYYRVENLSPLEVRYLFCAMETDRSAELIDQFSQSYGRQVTGIFPGRTVGISYASTLGSDCVDTVSVFFVARCVWGSDSRIRNEIARIAREYDWDDAIYQKITMPLSQSHSALTSHGMLGIVVCKDKPMHWSIGLRPPRLH
ncbi:MAG: hypothetical protein ACC641_09695 [Acidiferrobacterales bacterium]